MKRIIFMLLALVISSCGISDSATPLATDEPTEILLPTVTPVCISPEPTQQDIDRALSYAAEAIDPAEWERTYTVSESRVSVTWFNDPQGAIIFLEALIFPCQYEEPGLDAYFGDGNWEAIFSNFEIYEMLDECNTDDGLRLYEFDAVSRGSDYEVRYWVENDTATRVITTMMTFPVGSEPLLDEYAFHLFPDLTTCS